MAVDPKRRQKKQEQRTAKRRSKQESLTREKNAGLSGRLTAAAGYPVLHSWTSEDLWIHGLGWVGLSRQLPNSFVAFSLFLVDRYCLGIKNAVAHIDSQYAYDSHMRKLHAQFRTKKLSPATSRKWVEGAVRYARSLGLHPHADYEVAKCLFGDIAAAQSTEELEFGKDGKPFFFAGPHETVDRCRRILSTLAQTCGPDGFHYMIPFADSDKVLPESMRHQEARAIGPDATGTIREFRINSERENWEDDGDQ